MSAVVGLQIAAGLALAVSFAGLIDTVRGGGLRHALEKGGVDPNADPDSMTEKQRAVVRRVDRRSMVQFVGCIAGLVLSIGYLSFTVPIFAVGWIAFCLVALAWPRMVRWARAHQGSHS